MGNSFDENAATWDENPRRLKLVEKVWDTIGNQLDFVKIQHVLDYGCGTGLLGFKMVEKTETVTFCDTSSGMLEQVKKKQEYYGYSNVKIIQTDFTTEQVELPRVDLIVSMLVLHHVEEVEKLLNRFQNHLNQDGLFCWIDIDQEDGSFHDDNTGIHHFGFSREQVTELLTKAGFKIEFFNLDLHVEKDRDGLIEPYPLFIAIGKKMV